MWHIFEKRILQGYQKWYSHVSNMLIQKYKYTNTQIHKYSIWRSARKTQHMVYFWKEDCSRISKIISPCAEHTNTKIQIHKYTNTAYEEVPERPNIWHIFEKRIVQGYQKSYFHVPNAQIQKYKFTNTQIHKYSIWGSARKTQHVVYFWKEDCSRISKILFPCAERTNTKILIPNTQIQHMTKCQKDPTCGIFLKKGLFKGIKILFPYNTNLNNWVSHSCTRSSFHPNPIYILIASGATSLFDVLLFAGCILFSWFVWIELNTDLFFRALIYLSMGWLVGRLVVWQLFGQSLLVP